MGPRALGIGMALLALCACAPKPVEPSAGRPQRIVSLDYCADQFVLKLADREQIAALSPDAQKPFSHMREAAAGIARIPARAEDALALSPDLIVRAYGGGPNAPALFNRAGVPVAAVGFAEDFDGVRETIRAMAQAFGQPKRGEALIAEMDARLAAVRPAVPGASALYLTQAGVTTGPGGLIGAMFTAAGLENFEQTPGWRSIPLERLAHEAPDVVAFADLGAGGGALDPWSPARHPVARRRMEGEAQVRLDGAWTACGGWFVVEAVEALAAGPP